MRTMKISKKVGFDSAHFLPSHTGKCKRMHGHNWVIEVTIAFENVPYLPGMLLDFGEIKQIGKYFDHKVLNDLPEFKHNEPTAENLSQVIASKILEQLKWFRKGPEVSIQSLDVKVWESENAFAQHHEIFD